MTTPLAFPPFGQALVYRIINRLPQAPGRWLDGLIPRRMLALPFIPLRPADLDGLGHVLIVAPHADDEALGCGGLIASLAQAGRPVSIVFATDGGASHGDLGGMERAALVSRRMTEARNAVATLAGTRADCLFLAMRDGRVPFPGEPTFGSHVDQVVSAFRQHPVDTLVLPWRRDSSNDHRAVWHVFRQAFAGRPMRHLEYPIWAWMRETDVPAVGEMRTHRLDIGDKLALKSEAIACHATQVRASATRKAGLRRSFLVNFERPFEIFFEENV